MPLLTRPEVGGPRHAIGELTGDGRFEVRHTRRLVMPGPRSPSRWTMAGRGDVLHLISGTSHYQVDLDQLSA